MNKSHNSQLTASAKTKITKISVSFAIIITLFTNTLTAVASPITEENVLKAVNDQRIANKLTPLKIDSDLDRAATLKSKDMINRNYFDHYAFGLTPWVFIRNAGYDYTEAGENLAMDFVTAEGMTTAWMNSPKHRDNILNPNYEDIGIGIVKGEYIENNSQHSTYMVTNMFGAKKYDTTKILTDVVDRFSKILSFR